MLKNQINHSIWCYFINYLFGPIWRQVGASTSIKLKLENYTYSTPTNRYGAHFYDMKIVDEILF